jgi:hypothetical protein
MCKAIPKIVSPAEYEGLLAIAKQPIEGGPK